jgi:proteasome accessory factor B
MERTERLMDLVALLLNATDLVPFAELREHFPLDYGGEVTRESAERKLERDKSDLLALGIPIEYVKQTADGEPGGYRIERSAYFLEDPRLTPEEAAALYASGAAALAGRDFPFAQDLGHALRKIALAGSGSGPQPALPGATDHGAGAAAARRLLIVRPGDPARGGKLRALGDAVARRKKVDLVYQAVPTIGAEAPGKTERQVEPYGLAFRGGAWRLVAFCHLRQALRVFVVDRIESLRVSDVRPNQPDFEIPAGFDAGAVAGTRPWRWLGTAAIPVELRFAPGSELLAERSFDTKAEPLSDVGARAFLDVTWIEGLLPHVLSFGDRVWVEGPPQARGRVVSALEELSRRLAQPPAAALYESEPPPAAPSLPPPPQQPSSASSQPPPAHSRPPSRRPKSIAPADDVVSPDKRERLRRLLLIVPAARKKPGIKVDDLARELGLDAGSLLADIDLLSVVGHPPFNPDDLIEIFVDEQQRVFVYLDGSFGRPPQLTVLEALALTAAAREAAPADPAVVSALDKLTGKLPPQARELYSALARRVDTATPPPAGTPALLATLRQAAESRHEVILTYDRDGTPEERPLQPWTVLEHSGHWYVSGWDLTRKAERNFRIDRLHAVVETGQTFPDPGPLDLSRFQRAELFFPSGHEQPITLRFLPGAAAWALSRWGRKAKKLLGGGVEIAIESAGPQYAVSLALGFAGEAEIVEPPAARAAMREEVERTLRRYR